MSAWKMRRGQQREDDLERELRSDLELEAEEQQADGVSAEEAQYRALRAMGNTALVKEDVRRAWGGLWAEQFWQDFKYGLRGLRRRVEALDGSLQVSSPRNGPTRIHAHLPCAS